MPDMSKVKKSPRQKSAQQKFADAVADARSISRNPEKRRLMQKNLRKANRFTMLPFRSIIRIINPDDPILFMLLSFYS